MSQQRKKKKDRGKCQTFTAAYNTCAWMIRHDLLFRLQYVAAKQRIHHSDVLWKRVGVDVGKLSPLSYCFSEY